MSRQKKEGLCIAGLVILGLSFFYKTIYFDFINIDDPLHTSENLAVLTFDLKSLLTKYYISLYHPLTTLSFAIDWWLGGSKPWIFHLNNFVLHILATLVLLKICLKLWPKKYLLGFLISLTFMLHPLKVESVAWVTERKDVLSGLFLWLTIYIYLFYIEQKRLWQYILANIAFLLALAGKISVVPLPLFLFVIDWYRNQKIDFMSLVNKIPFGLLAFIFGLLNVLEHVRSRGMLFYPKKNYLDIFYQIHFYLEKFIFPWDLRAWYSFESINFNLLGVTTVALISLLAILIMKKSPAHKKDLIFGFALFALFLFPNIKVVTNDDINLVNDRYVYLALTGLTIAFFPFILHVIERLWIIHKRILSFTLSGAFIALIIHWVYLSYLQIPYWKDSVTLWQYTAHLEPNSNVVSGYLSKALLQEERLQEALPYLRKSQGSVEDYSNLVHVLGALNKTEEVENIILEGLRKYPENPVLLDNLGLIKYDHEQYQEALALFRQALHDKNNELTSGYNIFRRAIILNHAGMASMQLGNYKEAESFLRDSLAIVDSNDMTTYHLGLVLLKQNHLDDAKSVLFQAIKLNPNLAEAPNMIGAIFYQEKKYAEARLWFKRSLEVDPNYEIAKHNLMEMAREKH